MKKSINPHSSISVLTLLLSRCRVNLALIEQCLSAQQCFSFADEYVCTRWWGVVERILGKWRLLIVWLFSGVFGGLISACYALRESEQIVISVGASGAIMGIAGAAIATQLASGAGTHHKTSGEYFLCWVWWR